MTIMTGILHLMITLVVVASTAVSGSAAKFQQCQEEFDKKLERQSAMFEHKLKQQEAFFMKKIAHEKEMLEERLEKQERLNTALWKQLQQLQQSQRLPGQTELPQTPIEDSNASRQEKVSMANLKRSDDTGPMEPVVQQLAHRVDEISADIQTLKTSVAKQAEEEGSVYVHWGSTGCHTPAVTVYSGTIGGSRFSEKGGAANALCLPPNPTYGAQAPAGIFGEALLWGAEYEVHPQPKQNLDAQCAVCRTPRATTIMVPVSTSCTPGWTLEYSGFLMAGHYDHDGGTEFICVDSHMAGLAGTEENDDGHLLYFTLTRCGSLACPPFQEGKTAACVVCSK